MRYEPLDELVEVAVGNLYCLNSDGPTRRVVDVGWLRGLLDSAELRDIAGVLPPLLLHLARNNVEALRSFDEDHIRVTSASEAPGGWADFLDAGTKTELSGERQWLAGRAELAVFASLLTHMPIGQVRIEPAFPNGRRADAAVQLDDGWVWIECSVLSTPDGVDWDYNYHGSDVPLQAGDPYGDAHRIFRKAYDKLGGTPAVPLSQMHPSDPSVVILIEGSAASAGLQSGGSQMALHQLLHPADDAEESSLRNFLTEQAHCAESAIQNLSLLSGIMTRNYDLSLDSFDRSTRCDESHILTDVQFQDLKRVIDLPRSWG